MRLTARDRGSVLALVPAGFLVLVLLGSLAVDSAVAYQRQQQLHDALSAAANDAVTAGLDDSSFYGRGTLSLDPAAAGVAVCRSMAAQGLGSLHGLQLTIAIGPESLRVQGTARIDAVFGRALPGFGQRQVRSAADAALSTGGQAAVGPFGAATPVDCAGAGG